MNLQGPASIRSDGSVRFNGLDRSKFLIVDAWDVYPVCVVSGSRVGCILPAELVRLSSGSESLSVGTCQICNPFLSGFRRSGSEQVASVGK